MDVDDGFYSQSLLSLPRSGFYLVNLVLDDCDKAAVAAGDTFYLFDLMDVL